MEIGVLNSLDRESPRRQYQINREMGKEAFLKLLVAQLEHQDPLSPMDNTEFLAQLAQFSTLESINNLGTELGTVSSGINTLKNYTASALVGRFVKVEAGGFEFTGEPVRMAYSLTEDAESVTVTIRDSVGRPVRTLTPASTRKGEYELIWDGKDELGRTVRPGFYQVDVLSADSAGNTTTATTYIMERIRGIRIDNEQVYVSVGGMTIPLGDIKEIY